MMRRATIVGLGLLILAAGCSTPELQLDPKLRTYSREELEDMDEIEMPSNYSVDNFRKLQLGVAFEVLPGVDKKTGEALAIDPNLSTRLQTEMAKLKRFTVFSAHNRSGVTIFEALSDVDDQVKLQAPTDVKAIDLILSGKLTVSKERVDRYNDTILIYEVECDFSCEEAKTREVKFAEKARGRTARKVVLSFSGRKMAGYDDKDEQQAITHAAMKALAVMANKLGNAYPVGGRVTGISASGERMTAQVGYEEGFGKNQQCVIFVSDEGVDIPLALAEAVPKNDGTSSLVVYRWANSADAKPMVKALRKNGRVFPRNNKVYAVGYGLPVPPEWENAYEGSMDEQLRLQ